MNVMIRQAILVVILSVCALSVQAQSLNQCLRSSESLHRLERDQRIVSCFNMYKSTIGSENCFKQVTKLKAAQQSQNLSENLKYICFYEASIFQNTRSCMQKTSEFKNAENHDEAVFNCYKQFQETTSKKECITVAQKLIYPLKKDYLLQHCYNN